MLPDRLHESQHDGAQKMFNARMAALFAEIPMLCGFFVQDDLSVAELSVHTWPGWSVSSELREDIGRFLQAMVEARPELAELLRGRTFARSLQ
jgi:hypothetical protein